MLPQRIVRSLHSWRDSYVWGTFLAAEPPRKASGKATRENPACHISYEFWMLPAFVTLFGTIWLPNLEEWCHTKLTCKRARPSITIKPRTKQQLVESYSGSREDILQLLQTWETKSFIKWSFSRNKKLFASERSKNSIKCFRGQILSQTKSTGNQCWNAQETHWPHDLSMVKDNFCSVKTKNSPQHTAPVCLLSKVQVSMIKRSFDVELRVCTAWQRALLSDALLLYSQFPKEISFFLMKG